mgnify:CR=1 FL=1
MGNKKGWPYNIPKPPRGYYVYKCFVDGILRYVGMGKNNRIKHCGSGKSHVIQLNKDFFEGSVITTEKIFENLTEKEAAIKERKLIRENFDTLYNKVLPKKARDIKPKQKPTMDKPRRKLACAPVDPNDIDDGRFEIPWGLTEDKYLEIYKEQKAVADDVNARYDKVNHYYGNSGLYSFMAKLTKHPLYDYCEPCYSRNILVFGTYYYSIGTGSWRVKGKSKWYTSRGVDHFLRTISRFVILPDEIEAYLLENQE